jgi:predicted phosphate transport protein (TIGR00153 family)
MVRLRLLSKDHDFFVLFEEAGTNMTRAAGLLEQLLAGWPDENDLVREIVICEHKGDRITHDLIHRLNTSSHTPLDRSDIYELARALDDVVDYIEEAADALGLYQIEAPMEQAQRLAGVLSQSAGNIEQALARLDGMRDLNQSLVEINRLENEGDRIAREALASLFAGGIDPTVIIRWKDIFEKLEQGIDACERVSHIIEGMVVKGG